MEGTPHHHAGKGKGKQREKEAPASLLSNSRQLPAQDPYVPATQSLKKYVYAHPTMLDKNHLNKGAGKTNKRLGHHLNHLSSSAKASSIKAHEHDDLLLDRSNQGLIEVENELERTWKVTQEEIVEGSAIGAQGKAFALKLDEFGPYALDYTRNGRHLAIAGRRGHVGTFDWQSGRLHTELHLGETARAIRWLHDESFFAVAQKRYVYIYDKSGLEVHQLRNHIEVNQMEFLPYHFLLATIGNPGYLKYQDTSTGQLVVEHRTKLGACRTMAQNAHNAFIHLGHQNGSVTLWSPSVSRPQVQLQAHRGPVSSIALDPSTLGYRMVTCGVDGSVKLWDTRKWAVLNEYQFKKTPTSVDFSQKGLLGLGWGNHISVFKDLQKPDQNPRMPPPPYLTHTFPGVAVNDVRFCPFEDVLGVGHARGFTSLLVPGAGEANFDSLEADPYEGKRRRREREVNALLDKVPFDMITLDTEMVGKLDRNVRDKADKINKDKPGFVEEAFRKKSRVDRLKDRGQIEEDEEGLENEDDEEALDEERRKEKKRVKLAKADAKNRGRGRNSTLKKALRKRKRNVIDPITVALKEKLERQRAANKQAKKNVAASRSAASGSAGALDRFAF
ncbi:BQ2448_1794 [Microbotryum intermedium]|uniref:U three protein 7 n=1 Tax=Microbotryum intermedium TaxID=269621 RepID=A0A238F986_9BASI|nr:BQ2448_1794 [Microbotryum intermedium]